MSLGSTRTIVLWGLPTCATIITPICSAPFTNRCRREARVCVLKICTSVVGGLTLFPYCSCREQLISTLRFLPVTAVQLCRIVSLSVWESRPGGCVGIANRIRGPGYLAVWCLSSGSAGNLTFAMNYPTHLGAAIFSL